MATEALFRIPVEFMPQHSFGTDARLARIEQRLEDIETALRRLLEQQGKTDD